jgi:hypothetical protein
MSTDWRFDERSRLHLHLAEGRFSGYRIEPPQSNDDLDPVVGHLAGRFNLIFPGSDAFVTYDSLAEAKEAAEQLYQLDAPEFPSP